MSQSAFFPVKPSVQSYSDRKPCACQNLGNGPGVGECPAPGQCKICKCPTLGTDKACKCSAVARGAWAQVELTDALPLKVLTSYYNTCLEEKGSSSVQKIMLCEKKCEKKNKQTNKQTNIPTSGKFCVVASQCATNADCRLAGTSVNEVNIDVKCSKRFPIPKLDF